MGQTINKLQIVEKSRNEFCKAPNGVTSCPLYMYVNDVEISHYKSDEIVQKYLIFYSVNNLVYVHVMYPLNSCTEGSS